jgi:hypothetical protein
LLTVIQTLVSKGYKEILRVLNAVGGYHLQGLYLKDKAESRFKLIIRLVEEGKLDEAEETSNNFPFERNEVKVEPITIKPPNLIAKSSGVILKGDAMIVACSFSRRIIAQSPICVSR